MRRITTVTALSVAGVLLAPVALIDRLFTAKAEATPEHPGDDEVTRVHNIPKH